MSNQASSIIVSIVRFAHLNHFPKPSKCFFSSSLLSVCVCVWALLSFWNALSVHCNSLCVFFSIWLVSVFEVWLRKEKWRRCMCFIFVIFLGWKSIIAMLHSRRCVVVSHTHEIHNMNKGAQNRISKQTDIHTKEEEEENKKKTKYFSWYLAIQKDGFSTIRLYNGIINASHQHTAKPKMGYFIWFYRTKRAQIYL